ncbi:DUF1643 domain-containing protein [Agathobaculum sp. LCP25S3_E8]|uniref:DUF1643 domain-containing protein n=1 Tax=Agathobaculum sp. LCP25S3_E8 TaxID=3438735 RepID=UPI003F8F992D
MNKYSWIYRNDSDNLYRYALGFCSKSPLLCVGVNPSTATPEKLDPTINSVARIAKSNGYDGWIMINLYPQRSTNPNEMDSTPNKSICQQNLSEIKYILNKYNISEIWAAWGTLITKRDFLKECLKDIYSIAPSCTWITFGSRTKAGHPHHPLYLNSHAAKSSFDIIGYINDLIE